MRRNDNLHRHGCSPWSDLHLPFPGFSVRLGWFLRLAEPRPLSRNGCGIYSYPYPDIHTDANLYANTNLNPYTDSDKHAHSHTNTFAHCDIHTDPYSHCYLHSNPHTNADIPKYSTRQIRC